MHKFLLLLALLLSGTLFVAGCDSGSDDNDGDNAAQAETNDASNDAAPAADQADADADDEEMGPAIEDFSAVQPTGLRVIDKFNIAGRGTTYIVGCNPVTGAVSYSFQTSSGYSEITATPQITFMTSSGAAVDVQVRAKNADGVWSKIASLSIN